MATMLASNAVRTVSQKTTVSGGGVSMKKKVWVRNKSTFSNQAHLKRLPVPRLTKQEVIPPHHQVDAKYEPTLDRWLKSIEPVVSREELKEAQRITEEFGRVGGVGEKLTAELRKRADANPNTSWLAKWWASWAYMGYRESILINVSYHYIFDEFPNKATQLERGALMAYGFLNAMKLIQEERLQPDEIRKVPQCMQAYSNMFGTCRIPEIPDDYLSYATSEQCRHIIVACKNLFFKLDCFDPKSGLLYSPASLQSALQSIVSQANKLQGSQPNIGILTTQHRDKWTEIRKNLLLSDSRNLAPLKAIEQSSFVLNLDDFNPVTVDDTCATLLHGKAASVSASNRFFDKAFNIVIFPDGRAGLVGEHSGIDGYPTTVISDMVWEMTADPSRIPEILGEESNLNVSSSSSSSSQDVPSHHLLEFSSSPSLDNAINEAIAYHDKNASNVDMTLLKFDSYGTKEIKAAGVSPDGFVQMAFQLAYHRLHKEFAPVYESCSTRQYLHGRTEVGRSLSNDAVQFVLSMDNPKLSPSDKYAIFKQACESHIAYIRDASDGYGCDRHILGMKLIAQELGLKEEANHPFFALPAHSKSTHWKLSTSQLPSAHSVTGFGPVFADGYGIFYNLRSTFLNFHLSSWNSDPNTDCRKLSSSLSTSLKDLHAMCRAAATSSKAKL
jgi:carnitine O-acetyltransferase